LSTIFMQESVHFSKFNYSDSQFPELLREIQSPPQTLFVRGALNAMPLIALIGSRHPSAYGLNITRILVRDLVFAGFGIVSGLALGIDAADHEAALDAGGYTLAVLGCGIDQVYPASNRELATRILESGGAIISEQPPGMPPLKQHFPARNRIIAGLVQGVIITEAAAQSGTLHTANFALSFGRTVMAVPGDVFSPWSAGPHNIIRSGGVLVRGSSDVLDQFDLPSPPVGEAPTPRPANEQEKRLLDVLLQGVGDSQELITRSGLDARTFAQTITLMELSGKVKNLGSGLWALSTRPARQSTRGGKPPPNPTP
jgi:DNA processing protein